MKKPDWSAQDFHSGLQELRALMDDQTCSVHLNITRWQAYCLIAQVQLALRHPGNTGASRPVVEQIARELEQLFSDSPTLAGLLKRGWRKEFDR